MTQAYSKPLPKIDALNKPFWDFARERRLAVQTCNACNDAHFPPSPVCPRCLSKDQSWKEVSGKAVLESWIEMHRAYWPAYAEELPYTVCVVRLQEGPLLVSNIVGDKSMAKIGAPVEVTFERVTDQVTLPKFRFA